MMGYARISPGNRVLFNHAHGIYATSAVLPGLRVEPQLKVKIEHGPHRKSSGVHQEHSKSLWRRLLFLKRTIEKSGCMQDEIC